MSFKYVGEVARVYPDLSLEVEPGDVVDLDAAPDDGRWESTDEMPAPSDPPVEPVPAPIEEP